jgi:hypothetical protein
MTARNFTMDAVFFNLLLFECYNIFRGSISIKLRKNPATIHKPSHFPIHLSKLAAYLTLITKVREIMPLIETVPSWSLYKGITNQSTPYAFWNLATHHQRRRFKILFINKQDKACSCNLCYSGKSVSITYSEIVFLALGIQHKMRMRHILICGLPGCTNFCYVIS